MRISLTRKVRPAALRFRFMVMLMVAAFGADRGWGQSTVESVAGFGDDPSLRLPDGVTAWPDDGDGQVEFPGIGDLAGETPRPRTPEAGGVEEVFLDVVYLSNAGVTVLFDHFDDMQLGPEWFVVGGDPGPETGTVLELHSGDGIIAPVLISTPQNTFAVAHMHLAQFPPGVAMAMLLTGNQPGDQLLLVILRSFAVLLDERGLLGVAALNPGATTATPVIFMTDGFLIAAVNGSLVYAGENTLGTTTSIGIFMID